LNTTVYKQIDIDANAWECQQCKEAWCLEDGSPKENRMNYCPFCGVKIEGEIFAEDDAEMFTTNCDWCGALIRCDGEDFFLEPPEVDYPVVVCEECYTKHCERMEREEKIPG